jgi:hypothetical protein
VASSKWLVGMMASNVYGQLVIMITAPTAHRGSPLVHQAAVPSSAETTAMGACIANPRLYDGAQRGHAKGDCIPPCLAVLPRAKAPPARFGAALSSERDEDELKATYNPVAYSSR